MRTWLRASLIAAALLCAPGIASAQMAVQTVSITTDGSGNATVYSPPTFGMVVAVRYVPAAVNALDTGASLTITDSGTGLQVLSQSTLGTSSRDWWPRAFTVSTTGVAALFAGGGSNVLDLVPVAGAIKVVVASGGSAKSGTLYFFVQGR